MNEYEMTLIALSEKRVRVSAESAEAAADIVQEMYFHTDALDFADSDVTDVTVMGELADTE